MKWWPSKITGPSEFKDYRESVEQLTRSKAPLTEQKFLIIDTETTGLDIKTDRVISIGVVPMTGYTIHPALAVEWILPAVSSRSGGIDIHEILPSEKTADITREQVAREFLKMAEGAVIVGHHIEFDVQMMSKFTFETVGQNLLNPFRDTSSLYGRVNDAMYLSGRGISANMALDVICKELDIDVDDRHTALGDAAATAFLFMRLLKQLEKRKVTTVRGLFRK